MLFRDYLAPLRWFRYAGESVVTCPENGRHVGVRVDILRSATGTLQLKACSRWPAMAGCGQECLSQIQAAPADCLVRNIADHWYDGKA